MSSTHRWATALATVALIGLPIRASAQPPQAQKSSTRVEQNSPATRKEHLDEARRVLAELPSRSLSRDTGNKIAELKTHFNERERAYSKSQSIATGQWHGRNGRSRCRLDGRLSRN